VAQPRPTAGGPQDRTPQDPTTAKAEEETATVREMAPTEEEATRRRAEKPVEKKDERGGWLGFFRELPGLIIIAFVLALLIKTFLVQAFYIPSQSMVPTLRVGDRVLVNKLVYDFGDIRRGDVIVFENPTLREEDRGPLGAIWDWLTEGLGFATEPGKDFIKRVVGLPGETIEVRKGNVFIDGRPLDEPYVNRLADRSDFPPTVVEEDHVFVMGDNRPNSQDSRSSLGQIPFDKVVGKAFVLLWPPSRIEWLSDD
jgi:signal peptidase I